MHNFNIIKKSIDFAGSTLTVETGRMAKQANGSVFITLGETSLLVTATAASEAAPGQNFFPLTVDYVEKMYAAGKIPGGFFKREAKPSVNATLTSRLIDRAIRPLFPDGFLNAVHVVINVLSYDGINDPAPLGMIGASLALQISDIPFRGPIGGITMGCFDDEIVAMPSLQLLEKSKLELSVAGTESSVVMIEAGAVEVSESVMIDAIYQGHEEIQKICRFQNEFSSEVSKEKMTFEIDIVPEDITDYVTENYTTKIKEAFRITEKLDRYAALDGLKADIKEKAEEILGEEFEEKGYYYSRALEELEKKLFRDSVIKDKIRVDGRKFDEIRPITCEVDILPRTHGSALFTRGETQSLGTVTLGTPSDEQIIDGLAEEYRKNYFLHYNFPPFSVGEAGFMRAPGRRELGHGALAERALLPMMPDKDDFPYTIRIVSDILESNGSSSMATVCSGTMSLLAAGVPLKKPVAGIANGLIMDGEEFEVLTDIQGMEDHLGDMDFKVTGTRDGITAMQMDIKIEGITREIMEIALTKALAARLYILDKIEACIPETRSDLCKYAPRIESMKVRVDQIALIIGPGGKNIKKITEMSKADISIEEDGTVKIASPDGESIAIARKMIYELSHEPEAGEIFEGEIVRIEPYGVFVKYLGGKQGLVHVSQMSKYRLNHPDELIKMNQKIKVKFMGLKDGKSQLAMKNIEGNPELEEAPERKPRPERSGKPKDGRKDFGRGGRGRDNGSRR